MTGRDADLVRSALTIDDRLDDLRRARMWQQVETRIEGEVAPVLAPGRYRGAIAGAAMLAAAAAIAFAVWPRGGGAGDVFVAPAETTLMAPLGPHTNAALVGPARAELVGLAGDATTVRLDAGTLLAEFEGGAGRSLHVDAPGLAVDVVGTLFAVEVRPQGSCVSVSHGRVRATIAGQVRFVGGGERSCTDAPAPAPIAAAVDRALVQHEARLASSEREPVPAPPPPAVPAPAVPAVAVATPPALTPALTPTPLPPRAPTPTPTPTPRPHPLPVRSPLSLPKLSPLPMPLLPAAPPPPAVATRTPVVVRDDPPPPPPRFAQPNAEDRYRDAESALAVGDVASAERLLASLVADFPTSPLVDQALYERARLAYTRHAWDQARRALDALALHAGSPLTEPGRYLACRVAVEAHDGDAARCIVDYRATYPQSPHDLDLLATLVQLHYAAGGCTAASAAIAELVAHAPSSKLADAWVARCPVAPSP